MAKERKKNFLTGLVGTSLVALVFQAIFVGIIQATAAFFAKYGWEKWKGRRDR
jgi:hypothetical protein